MRTRQGSCACNLSSAVRTSPSMADGSTVSSRRNIRRAMAIESRTASTSACWYKWLRYSPRSPMLLAKRSIVARTSSAAPTLAAASPSQKPICWASRERTSTACSSSAMRTSSACIGSAMEGSLDVTAPLRSSVSPAGVTVRHANGRARSGELSTSTLDDILVVASLEADDAFGLQLLDLRDDLLLRRLHVFDSDRPGGIHVFFQHLRAALGHARGEMGLERIAGAFESDGQNLLIYLRQHFLDAVLVECQEVFEHEHQMSNGGCSVGVPLLDVGQQGFARAGIEAVED